jgi:hypothetical protein
MGNLIYSSTEMYFQECIRNVNWEQTVYNKQWQIALNIVHLFLVLNFLKSTVDTDLYLLYTVVWFVIYTCTKNYLFLVHLFLI